MATRTKLPKTAKTTPKKTTPKKATAKKATAKKVTAKKATAKKATAKKATAKKAAAKKATPKKTTTPLAPPPEPAVVPRPLPPQAEALMRQILADPDDLDPRRVYADLLVEHGALHGESIQLDCALRLLDRNDPHRATLEQTVETQLGHHGLALSRDLRRVGPFNRSSDTTICFAFARGLPELLRGVGADIVPLLQQAVEAAPIRALELEATAADLQLLAASPALGQIRALSLNSPDDPLPAESVIDLLASPHLRRLEHLSLCGQLNLDLARALAGCAALGDCRELVLSEIGNMAPSESGDTAPSGLGPEGLGLLCRSGRLDHIEALSLSQARVGAAVAELGALHNLRWLSIAQDKLSVEGARALAAAEGLGGLEALTLEACGLDARALVALVEAPRYAGLRRLDLSGRGNGLGRGLEALLGALALPHLEALGLRGGAIRERGAGLLTRAAAHDTLARLQELDLTGCGLKDDGLAALATARLPELRVLNLSANTIGAAGLAALAASPLLASVRDLDLANNKCQNAGAVALAACPHLAGLERLRLYYNWMGVGGLRAILAVTPKLVELVCGENNYANAPGQVVARSDTLTHLRRLTAYEQNGPTVTELALSPAGRRLERLQLDAPQITDEGAEALAALPNLGELHLSFPTISDAGRAVLRRRFGPFLSVSPDVERWNALPGPD